MVICLKKFIYFILISVLIGSVFAFALFKRSDKKIEDVINIQNSYTAFQLGVYKNKNNALNKKNKFKGSIIVNDDDFYRVYFSILNDSNAILKMNNYLKDQQINFYKKEIEISNNNFINLSTNYEQILNKTDSEEVFLETNQKILEEFLKINDQN